MSFIFDRNKDRDSDWRKIKLEHYREFFAALAAIAERNASYEDQKRFSRATNTVQLVASKEVIDALHYFREYIDGDNEKNHSLNRHEELLSELIRAIRRDLGMSLSENPHSTTIRLWNSG